MLDPQKLPEKWWVVPWDTRASVDLRLCSHGASADSLLGAGLRVPWNSVVATEAGTIAARVDLNASLPWLWLVHFYVS